MSVSSAAATIYGLYTDKRIAVLAFLGMTFAVVLLLIIQRAIREVGKAEAQFYDWLVKAVVVFVVVYFMLLSGFLFPGLVRWLSGAQIAQHLSTGSQPTPDRQDVPLAPSPPSPSTTQFTVNHPMWWLRRADELPVNPEDLSLELLNALDSRLTRIIFLFLERADEASARFVWERRKIRRALLDAEEEGQESDWESLLAAGRIRSSAARLALDGDWKQLAKLWAGTPLDKRKWAQEGMAFGLWKGLKSMQLQFRDAENAAREYKLIDQIYYEEAAAGEATRLAKAGDFANARRIAVDSGSFKVSAIKTIAEAQYARGDKEAAVQLLELVPEESRSWAFLKLAEYAARSGDSELTRRLVNEAGPVGKTETALLVAVQGLGGDGAGARAKAERLPTDRSPDTPWASIGSLGQRAQAFHSIASTMGDRDALKMAESLDDLDSAFSVCVAILGRKNSHAEEAMTQATRFIRRMPWEQRSLPWQLLSQKQLEAGDFSRARRSAANVATFSEWAYGEIASAEVKSGDLQSVVEWVGRIDSITVRLYTYVTVARTLLATD